MIKNFSYRVFTLFKSSNAFFKRSTKVTSPALTKVAVYQITPSKRRASGNLYDGDNRFEMDEGYLLRIKEGMEVESNSGITFRTTELLDFNDETEREISVLDQDGNTLVLFQFVEKHGKILYDLIKEKAHERRKVFFVSGEVDAEVREEIRGIVEKQKNAIIVASLGTFSTGVNIRNLHNIIFASPSKSQVKVLQSIGRGLRKSEDGRTTVLFDLMDDMHYRQKKNYTLIHAIERMKIYKKEEFDFEIFEVKL